MERRGKTFRDLVQDAKANIKETTPEEVKQWLDASDDMVIVDVRQEADYEAGHIDGSLSIPRGVLELYIDEKVPNQDAKIVLYCGGGSRSALAAETLQQMGYANVLSMAGGWKGWSGLPAQACSISQ